MATIFYYACNLDAVFSMDDKVLKLRLMTFYVTASTTYIMSADISHKARLQSWSANDILHNLCANTIQFREVNSSDGILAKGGL